MGKRSVPSFSGTWFHLVLRGRSSLALVQDEEDWRALEGVARRMLFWCGGAVHGVRCEASTMRFAVQLARASIGAVALHLSGGYAVHVRRRHRAMVGGVFKPYSASAIDGDTYLEDFVLWLHRPGDACWTANAAYLSPGSSWITTERVLEALGPAESARFAYRRLRLQPTDPAILAMFTRSFVSRRKTGAEAMLDRSATFTATATVPVNPRPTLEEIVRAVASYGQTSYEEMLSDSRRRSVAKARSIATVLCTRNGLSAAAVARFFRRTRSTLVEQVESYREKQPQVFDEAERDLAGLWGDDAGAEAARPALDVSIVPITRGSGPPKK